jgi:hypothetical protein
MDVRSRLIQLGLKAPSQKIRTRKAPAAVAPAETVLRPVPAEAELAGEAAEPAELDEDDDEFVVRRGRPRGYLMTEAAIAAQYRRAGRDYGHDTVRFKPSAAVSAPRL